MHTGHHEDVDATTAAMLRLLLQPTEWPDRVSDFAADMRRVTRNPSGLLLVGTPDDEPWHLAAHLDETARWEGIPEISPVLVRWTPPREGPQHLTMGMRRLDYVRRGDLVLVVAPTATPPRLLERVDDAKKSGGAVFSIDSGDDDLNSIAHESLSVTAPITVPPHQSNVPVPDLTDTTVAFETVQHLVNLAAGETTNRRGRIRARLARALEAISGPSTVD